MTPLIPSKTTLSSTKYTPAEMVADKAVENWLFALPTSDSIIIRNIMTYYREGSTSYTHTFTTRSDALIAYTNFTAYGYTVTGPSSSPDKTVIISWD